jgi:SAM-dependent MidA family methyltransferase
VSGLRAVIEGEIRERGPLPFSRYMESCLYHPQFGYYSRSAEQFGKAGDFYTSSDVHAVFGRLLARQFEEMWRALGSPERIVIKELGPGRGLFAQDVMDWAEKKFTDFFRALRYELVEQSPALRQRIAATSRRRFESGQVVFGSLEQHRDCPVILFANEFFDAIPVEVVSARGSLRIDARDGRFVESWAAVSPQELQYLDRYSVRPEEAERLEVPLQSQELISEAVGFDRGFVVVVDYGYTRQEQLAGRHRGTIKAMRQHSVSGTPYEAPGEQDITADVNFTALTAAVQQQGFRAEKLVTQSQFLMGIGESTQFADAFEDCRLPQERAKVALQLKHLVTPAGMGESFHALVASKGVAEEKAANLSGLSFGNRNLRAR